MSRRTKVRIKRMQLLLFLSITTIGTVYALVRSLFLRQIIGLLFAASAVTLIGEWMGPGLMGLIQAPYETREWRCKSADNR